MAADPKASKLYEDALVRFEKKDFKGAIVQLKNAIQIDRKMLPVHLLLGRSLLADGEVNAAEAAFDEALKLGVNPAEVVVPLAEAVSGQGKLNQLLTEPRFAHASLPNDQKAKLLLLKAAAASNLGNSADALKLLGELRAIDAGSVDSWADEVPIRIRARQFPEAKSAADKAVALGPQSPRAAYQQASVAHVTGDLKTAVTLYTRTLSLKADHVDALVARGGLYIDLKRFDEAAADIKAARAADPKDPRAAYLVALLAERGGQAAEVKKALNEVTNLLDPLPVEYIRYRPQLLLLGGLSHFALDQYEKAKPYLETVLRQDASSPVSKLLARIYLKEKRVDMAVEALEQYLRRYANDGQATMLLATSYMAQGRHARSAQLMQEALKKGDDPSMHALLGMSLVGTGKYASAVTELETSLKKDPGQIQAGTSLAGLYLTSGQADKAIAVIEALIKRQPANAGLVNFLGSALAAKGDAAAARKAFEQALKLDPAFVEPQINIARIEIDLKQLDAAQNRLAQILAKDERNVDAAIEFARMFSARGRADESLRWLQKADDASGPRLRAGLQMVEFHLARGRPDLAREPLKRLQARAPEALLVLLAQARVQLANNEANDAKSTLNRAASLASYDPAALVQIATLQVSAGNLPGAAHALDKALAERPTHVRGRALRSSVHLMQGEPAKAEQLARNLISSEPKLGLGHALLGDVLRARKQLPAAIESYRRAHQLDHSAESLARLFNALEGSQRAEAIGLADKWLRDKPADVAVWRLLADAQARLGQMPAARQSYEALLKLTPDDAEALNNLAVVMVSLGDAGALKVAERALALKPDVPYIIGTTGWAAYHAQQPDRAVQLLRDARLRDPNNATTRYFLGTVLAKQGRKTEAREEIESALRGGISVAYAKDAQALLQTLK